MTTAETITQIRSFNRFYTRFVGALDKSHLGSGLPLPEARVVYELTNQPGVLASQIVERLGVDPGYLSRMLKRLETQGLISRERSDQDGRAAALFLTDAGRKLFHDLNYKAAERVGQEIVTLGNTERERLTAAMGVITHLLGKGSSQVAAVRLRGPEPGDFGWAVERHGLLYAEEYGWGSRFEGLVAELFGGFARAHNPVRERCWIAELDGNRAGCVFVVERTPEVAQLRCLLVEPAARGHGIGSALVTACIEFARNAGYRQMILWTNKGLDSARKIYEAAGFRLVKEQPHRDFGPELIGQNWELDL